MKLEPLKHVVLYRVPAEPGWRYLRDHVLVAEANLRPVTHWAFVETWPEEGSPPLRLPCEGTNIIWDVCEVTPPEESFLTLSKRILAKG